MAESGLTAEVLEDVSAYKSPASIFGVKVPKRYFIAIVAGLAFAIAIGALSTLVLHRSVESVWGVLVAVAAVCGVAGFYTHKGLVPEEYLPYMVPRRVFGHRLVRRSPDIDKLPRPNEGMKRSREYEKAIKKRGAKAAEVYLVRIEEAAQGEQGEGQGGQARGGQGEARDARPRPGGSEEAALRDDRARPQEEAGR